ncbi:MAG: glycosyltransferase family 4 protein, partial [Candidatus Levyibacteriota bacterium]
VLAILHALARFLDALILKNTDAILVGGDAHDNYLKKIAPQTPIITIPPSVHPLKKLTAKKKNYILMVTAWKEGKNPEYIFGLLKAYPKFAVVMAGKWLDPNLLKVFQKNVKVSGFTKQITVTGQLSEGQLTQYYSEALFLLQTNDDRGFGLPALEAAGHGTTFLIPRGQGVCNLFTNGTHGYYVKEHDTNTIVKKISDLYEDKEKAKKMGKLAWGKVIKNYSWRQHAVKLVNLAKRYEKK